MLDEQTPYDGVAAVRVWALLDDFTRALARALDISDKGPAMARVRADGAAWVAAHPHCKYDTPRRRPGDPV